nr:hypothetical protein [Escherichia coli]
MCLSKMTGNTFPAGYPQCRRAATLAVLEF